MANKQNKEDISKTTGNKSQKNKENKSPDVKTDKGKRSEPKGKTKEQSKKGKTEEQSKDKTKEQDIEEDDVNEEIRVIYRELILYLFFLAVVLVSAYGLREETRYYYTKAMEDLFIRTQADNGKSFSEMTSIADFWAVIESILIDGFFSNYWYKSHDFHKTTSDDDKKVLYENKLIGRPRIRQVRVRPNSCVIQDDFRRSFSTCYAPYSISAEDHTSFGPELGSLWNYNPQHKVGSISYWGKLATYAGGGYYEDLPISSEDEMVLALAILKDNIWIRRGTRAVFIDFTVYNANVNLFCIVKMTIELPPTGGVVPSWDFNTVKLLHYVTAFDFFVLGCELTVIVFIILFIIEEVVEIIHFKLQYFHQLWNLFDWAIIMLSLTCIAISIYRTVVIDYKLDRIIENPDEYPNFESLGFWETQYQNVKAVVVFLVWIKILKFIKFNKTMNQLATTLRRCQKDITGFSVMFVLVFLAYAQLGHLMFGDQLESFHTFVRSIFTLLRTLLGDFDYESIAEVDRVAGPIFFLTYIFIVFFILLNVFIAIISDTYSEVKSETEGVDVVDMGKFLCNGCRNILVKLKIMKPRSHKKLKLTGLKIREILKTHNFSDLEIRAFLDKYGIKDEELEIDDGTVKKMLKDMEGKTNEDILQEWSGGYPASEIDRLKKRIEHIENNLSELSPKIQELNKTMKELFED